MHHARVGEGKKCFEEFFPEYFFPLLVHEICKGENHVSACYNKRLVMQHREIMEQLVGGMSL
jgi:hypothetical protein